MRPTLRQMQYIVAVAETGRFGDAAARMNVSQPSLSTQIADVETLLGVTLFERGRRGALLTEKGGEFVQRARLILRQVEELSASMQRETSRFAGRVRLGTLPTIGPYLLPHAVQKLHKDYPALRLTVRDESTVALDAGLRDGRFDTVISTAQDHPGCASAPLFNEDMWICVSEDDPLAGREAPVKLSELEGRTLLTLGPGHRLSIIVQRLADRAGARVDGEYEGTSLDALRQMAATGTGVAILPRLYTRCEARRDPTLTLRRVADETSGRRISLVWRKSSPMSEEFTVIAELLRNTATRLLDV